MNTTDITIDPNDRNEAFKHAMSYYSCALASDLKI